MLSSIFSNNGSTYKQSAVFGTHFTLNQTALEVGLPALTGSNAWKNLTANLSVRLRTDSRKFYLLTGSLTDRRFDKPMLSSFGVHMLSNLSNWGIIRNSPTYIIRYLMHFYMYNKLKSDPMTWYRPCRNTKRRHGGGTLPSWFFHSLPVSRMSLYSTIIQLKIVSGLITVIKGQTTLPWWSYIVALILGAFVTVSWGISTQKAFFELIAFSLSQPSYTHVWVTELRLINWWRWSQALWILVNQLPIFSWVQYHYKTSTLLTSFSSSPCGAMMLYRPPSI